MGVGQGRGGPRSIGSWYVVCFESFELDLKARARSLRPARLVRLRDHLVVSRNLSNRRSVRKSEATMVAGTKSFHSFSLTQGGSAAESLRMVTVNPQTFTDRTPVKMAATA